MKNKYYWWWSADSIMEKGPIVEDWHFNPYALNDEGKGTWECVTLDWYVDKEGNHIGEPVRIRHNTKTKTLTAEDEYKTAEEGYKAIEEWHKRYS